MEFREDLFPTWAAEFVDHRGPSIDLARPDFLDRSELDYSIASLKLVDEYLQRLHDSDESQYSDEEYGNAVLWAAAYFGEVIRRHAKGHYRWASYDALREALPTIAERVPSTETTRWLLFEPMGSVFTPIEKVMRRLSYGGDRLHPFAVAVLKEGI